MAKVQLIITGEDGTLYNVVSGDATLNIVPPQAPPVVPPVVNPPQPPVGAILIPATAQVQVLDNMNGWKGDYDTSTPNGGKDGSGNVIPGASGTSTFIDAKTGRQFTINYLNRAGLRFHNSFTNNTTSKNWVYDVIAKFNWTKVSRLELDLNQTLADGRTVMLCCQAAAGGSLGSSKWELTFSNTPHEWNPSNLPAPLSSWKDGEIHRIRIKTSRDDSGVVTYESVEVDGVNQHFDGNNVGASVKALSWPKGDCILNFQMEGADSKGVIQGTASIQVANW